MIQVDNLLLAFITFFLGILTLIFDRDSRYRYLAGRWNDLMNLNTNEPDFFNPEKTEKYNTWEDDEKKVKYNQFARMYWGFVEDVIRKDNFIDRLLRCESYVVAYQDTIKDCIKLHHAWLRNNRKNLFTYSKFRKVLSEKFKAELKGLSLELIEEG